MVAAVCKHKGIGEGTIHQVRRTIHRSVERDGAFARGNVTIVIFRYEGRYAPRIDERLEIAHHSAVGTLSTFVIVRIVRHLAVAAFGTVVSGVVEIHRLRVATAVGKFGGLVGNGGKIHPLQLVTRVIGKGQFILVVDGKLLILSHQEVAIVYARADALPLLTGVSPVQNLVVAGCQQQRIVRVGGSQHTHRQLYEVVMIAHHLSGGIVQR